MYKIEKIDKNRELLSIVENGIVISSARINKNVIEDINVNDKFRNISFGKKILKLAISEIANKDYDEAIVLDYNDASLNFFIKNKFILKDNKLILSGLRKEVQEKKKLITVSIVSLLINLVLAILKIGIGFIFSLNSIIADGINSATDSLSTVFAIFGLKISSKLEDEKHPFGYGKIEAIFNLFISFFIFITTASVFVGSIKKIFEPNNIRFDSNSSLIYIFTTLFIFFKILQYFYVNKTAKKYKNDVLMTLSKDYLADILLSSAVLIGVVLTIKFSYFYDIALSIGISIYIMYGVFNLLKENISILLETQDMKLIRKVKTIIMSNEEIFFCHDLFMIKSGKYIYMFADVRMDKDYSVEKSHEIAEEISLEIRNKCKNIKYLNLHVEPIYKK